MLKSLEDFLAGRMLLDTLINNLEGLLNILSSDDKIWKDSFLSLWGRLEDARAVALFRNAGALDAGASERVAAAAKELKAMVLEKLKDPIEMEQGIEDEIDKT